MKIHKGTIQITDVDDLEIGDVVKMHGNTLPLLMVNGDGFYFKTPTGEIFLRREELQKWLVYFSATREVGFVYKDEGKAEGIFIIRQPKAKREPIIGQILTRFDKNGNGAISLIWDVLTPDKRANKTFEFTYREIPAEGEAK